MIHQIHCPIADVSAADLGLLLDGPLPDVLANHRVAGPQGHLDLGVIGASHVASITLQGTLVFREEMSCNVTGPLPEHREFPGYEFRSTRESVSNTELAQWAESLDDSWLVAYFPGESPYHITALRGSWDASLIHWQTLHFYPEEQTIVTSQSRYII
ncbi:DUF2617 family protein [Corynebacterium freiburgense]|uniref:DUF2617 family protein n=1 Tax=Corynebacterium freiburgense TaxID=556548 RepID=UPI00047ED3C7|nr:DUF2617 family protein [Corynebacterium freiburgense]WJZ02294.1 hypothetical protein CFREI_04990 [Corynebacterium freiburgense]